MQGPHFPPDYFGLYLEYTLLPPEAPEGLPRGAMTIAERHLSAAGQVAHGGAIYSLMDYALGAAIFSRFTSPLERCSTVELHMHYCRPAALGRRLVVTPTLLHRGRTLVRMEGKMHDDTGALVGFATGTFNLYVLKG